MSTIYYWSDVPAVDIGSGFGTQLNVAGTAALVQPGSSGFLDLVFPGGAETRRVGFISDPLHPNKVVQPWPNKTLSFQYRILLTDVTLSYKGTAEWFQEGGGLGRGLVGEASFKSGTGLSVFSGEILQRVGPDSFDWRIGMFLEVKRTASKGVATLRVQTGTVEDFMVAPWNQPERVNGSPSSGILSPVAWPSVVEDSDVLTVDPQNFDIRIHRGDNGTIRFTVVDEDGNPMDLSTATLWFTVKASLDDLDAAAKFQKNTASMDTTLAASGVVDVLLSPSDTDSLGGRYFYDFAGLAGGKLFTFRAGRFYVEKDVTRAAS